MVSRKVLFVLIVAVFSFSLLGASSFASTTGPDTVVAKANFSPSRAGAATIASGGAVFTTTTPGGIPSPLVGLTIKGPNGTSLNLKGSKTCSEAIIDGPVGDRACPKNSIAGTGSGLGLYQLGADLIREPFTLSFYLADNRPGHVKMIMEIYGHSPVVIDIVVVGTVIQYHKPYGLGFHFNIPLIYSVPGASAASVSYSNLKIGNIDHASYKSHGKKIVIPGIVLPKTCPRHGFPVSTAFTLNDGSVVTDNLAVPCKK